jgi:hypothetical protein
MSQTSRQMSGEGLPQPIRPARQPVSVDVGTTADSSFVPVYAVRSPADLEIIRERTKPRSGEAIGGYLVGQGVITHEDLREALAIQRNSASRRLGWILCTLGHLDPLSLARLLAAHYGVPCVTLAHFRPEGDFRTRLPRGIADRVGIAVLHEEGGRAWVAVADVTDLKTAREAKAALGKDIERVMAPGEEIAAYLGRPREAADPGSAGTPGW